MIVLPFPPSSLSGHHNEHWRRLQPVKKKYRQWAHTATLAEGIKVPATGDIRVKVLFVPPDRRGDRTNYPNRMKPYFDGIADALKVNDRRFLPEYVFAEPEKPGRVEVEIIHTIAAESPANCGTVGADSGMIWADAGSACNTPKRPDHNRLVEGGD